MYRVARFAIMHSSRYHALFNGILNIALPNKTLRNIGISSGNWKACYGNYYRDHIIITLSVLSATLQVYHNFVYNVNRKSFNSTQPLLTFIINLPLTSPSRQLNYFLYLLSARRTLEYVLMYLENPIAVLTTLHYVL